MTRGAGSGDVNSGVRVRSASASSAGGGCDAVGEDQRRGRRREQPVGERGDRSGLVDADDLDAVRMREIEVADQRRRRGRLAAHHGPAFAPGGPGERKRLAVVLMQLRDVDLEHPAAMR